MLLIIQPNDIHNKHSATDNTVAYFFDKKSLTTRFGDDAEGLCHPLHPAGAGGGRRRW